MSSEAILTPDETPADNRFSIGDPFQSEGPEIPA